MKLPNFSDQDRRKIANWILNTKPVEPNKSWTETRLVVDFNGHTYIIQNDQIYQCARCGHYDPQWNTTVLLSFFKLMGIKPYEVEITCNIN